jgi:hypothetical protein
MITNQSKPPQQALRQVLSQWRSHDCGWWALREDNQGTHYVLSQWDDRPQRHADHA